MATVPECPPELHQRMTAPITVTEIHTIIKNLKKESVPAPLGILNQLLKEVSKYTLEILTKVGNKLGLSWAKLSHNWG